jgi:hypothetical protein
MFFMFCCIHPLSREAPECTTYRPNDTIIFPRVSPSSENVRQEVCSIQGTDGVFALQRKNFRLQANLFRGNDVKHRTMPENLLNKEMRMIQCEEFVSLRVAGA